MVKPQTTRSSKTRNKKARKAKTIDEPGQGKRGAEGHIAYILRQAQVAVRNAVERELASLDVTLPQYSVMTMLAAYGDLSAAETARLSMLTPQTMTVIVRNLERDGLISRTPDPDHGRILRLSLTDTGRATLAACRTRTHAIEARMVEGLSKRDEATVRAWLSDLADVFGTE